MRAGQIAGNVWIVLLMICLLIPMTACPIIVDFFTITFESNGGSAVAPLQGIESGSLVQKPADPVQTGYLFLGWFKDIALQTTWDFGLDRVEEDLTLYAKWEVITYSVKFQSNGGSAVPDIQPVPYGMTIEQPADPVKDGFEFAGWYKEAELLTTWDFGTDTVFFNLFLYAKWVADTYNVTFDSNGGSGVTPIAEVAYGSLIDKPADPTMDGYDFSEWYKEETFDTQWNFVSDTVIADITLFAKWTKITYLVTFDSREGSAPVPATIEVHLGEPYGSLALTERAGYDFMGWYTQTNGAGYLITAESLVGYIINHTLYALWKQEGIGEVGPAGGYIFYNKGTPSNGWQYLEAAPWAAEIEDIYWGPSDKAVGGTLETVGSGESNTNMIVATFGAGTYAASYCTNLEYGGYDDWFLPSTDELEFIHTNLYAKYIGGFSNDDYWSSTESGEYDALGVKMDRNTHTQINKASHDHDIKVRPIRAY
ncbi:MAG: InlB B-repeat-containing protein [Sphaerochaetaceae bacterium]